MDKQLHSDPHSAGPARDDRRLSVLRLVVGIGESSAPYNQFSLSLAHIHDITICSFFPPSFETPPPLKVLAGDGTISGYMKLLGQTLAKNRYDVIHCHTPHVGAMLFLHLLQTGTRPAPVVFTVHSSHKHFKMRNRLMMVPLFAACDKVVYCGKSVERSFPSWWKWLARKRQCAIPNGVDLDRIDSVLSPLKPLGEDSTKTDSFRVLSVGRLISIKNPLGVLNAFSQSGESHSTLQFLGDGSLLDPLVAEIDRLNLVDGVHAQGEVSREEVYRALSTADLFVSMSQVEGLPIAAIEAMACRVPVLLSDIPPHREIFGQESVIPLVDPLDTKGFAREITRIRALSMFERRQLGERCRKIVEERFSLTRMQNQYSSVFRSLQQLKASA